MAAYSFVDPPKMTPRKFGLFSVAELLDLNDHEMQDGIEWYADNCAFGSAVTSDVVCIGTPTRTPTVSTHPLVHAVSRPVYVFTQCAGVNDYRKAQDRAVAILTNAIERSAEFILNAALSADAAAVDYTSGTPTLKKAIANIEGILDDNYAGVGTIGMSRIGASLASSDSDLVNIHGNHLESSLGTPFFGSGNFNLGPAAVAPGAGNAWVWGMGKTQVRLGKQFVSDPVFIQSASVNEVQTLTISGVPTGGSYTLTFDGQTTTAIAYNANAATIQAALVALSNVDPGDVAVTGTGPFVITFGGQYAGENAAPITSTSSLTGGTAPAATVVTTTPGVNNFGDNTYRVMAQRNVLVSYDCFAGAVKAVLPT